MLKYVLPNGYDGNERVNSSSYFAIQNFNCSISNSRIENPAQVLNL